MNIKNQLVEEIKKLNKKVTPEEVLPIYERITGKKKTFDQVKTILGVLFNEGSLTRHTQKTLDVPHYLKPINNNSFNSTAGVTYSCEDLMKEVL